MADTSTDRASALPMMLGVPLQDDASMAMEAPIAYIMRASVGIADDHGDTAATATAISIGQTVQGVIGIDGDVDAFKLTVQGGSYYSLVLDSGTRHVNMRDAMSLVHLLPGGTSEPISFEIAESGGLFKADQTGEYAFLIKNDKWGNSSSMAYTLRVTTAFADDHANTIVTTAELPVGGTVSGIIETYKDFDAFKVNLQANHTYTFATLMPGDAWGGFGSLSLNTNLVLSDAGGHELAKVYSYYQVNQLTFTAPASGSYYLSYSHDVATWNRGDYMLRASDITGDTRKPVLTPVETSGIEPKGYFMLAADEYLNGKGPAEYMNANADIKLFDAAGNALLTDAIVLDFGTHSVLAIEPRYGFAPGATYALKVGSQSVADYAGNYVAPAVYTFTTGAVAHSPPIHGSSGNDVLTGYGSGASAFYGMNGSDKISGSTGLDTSIYAADRASYTVTKGPTSITVANSAEGVDTLVSIERLQFADKVIVFDHTGIEGQGYRMYRAVFDREPDAAGLGFYVKLLETGYTPYTISPFFVASPEFQGLYGSNPGNRDFVERLYHNVLHRDGEAGGVSFWLDLLDRKVLTQAEVVVGFSESPENIAATATLIGQGFEYIPYG